jgi:hypothetical protein
MPTPFRAARSICFQRLTRGEFDRLKPFSFARHNIQKTPQYFLAALLLYMIAIRKDKSIQDKQMTNRFLVSACVALLGAVAGAAFMNKFDAVPDPEKLAVCKAELDDAISKKDTRTESADHYYFENDQNRFSILTALATGKFRQEQEMASTLGRIVTGHAIRMGKYREVACDLSAIGLSLLAVWPKKQAVDAMSDLAADDGTLLAIMQRLKTEGDRRIASGAPPPPKDSALFL